MTRIEFKLAALAAAMALAVTGGTLAAITPAFGAGLVVSATNVPTARIGYADLDLRSRAGVVKLERRVSAAADRLCVGIGIETLAARLDGFKCHKAAIEMAVPQVRRAVERAGTEQAANGGAITLTLLR
jgi:UrcA family protein